MHCNCCDRELDDKEIIFNDEIGTWEMCSSCLAISMDAAFCDGFKKEDDEFIIIEEDDDLPLFAYLKLKDGHD